MKTILKVFSGLALLSVCTAFVVPPFRNFKRGEGFAYPNSAVLALETYARDYSKENIHSTNFQQRYSSEKEFGDTDAFSKVVGSVPVVARFDDEFIEEKFLEPEHVYLESIPVLVEETVPTFTYESIPPVDLAPAPVPEFFPIPGPIIEDVEVFGIETHPVYDFGRYVEYITDIGERYPELEKGYEIEETGVIEYEPEVVYTEGEGIILVPEPEIIAIAEPFSVPVDVSYVPESFTIYTPEISDLVIPSSQYPLEFWPSYPLFYPGEAVPGYIPQTFVPDTYSSFYPKRHYGPFEYSPVPPYTYW
ncbi:uncharacterized protein [Periplaneta americana]|uniref:uncharacterized protein n=1 Tax=Periplaneta americana TaxID=6978 RepID=UPI0037E93C45